MVTRCAVNLYQAVVLFFTLIVSVETKICTKREEIGHRQHNHYECNHPTYSECCEHSGRFTCCEPLFSKSLREQLQLWGMIAVLGVVGAVIYTCMVRDQEFIRSNTLQEAVSNITRKFGLGKSKVADELEDRGDQSHLINGRQQQKSSDQSSSHFCHL